MKRALLILNCVVLAVGNCGGPLIMRLYFLRGGERVWLSSWLETAGFPVLLLPLLAAAYARRRDSSSSSFVLIKRPLLLASAGIGVLTGVDNYLYAFGLSRLPVSTSSLIVATQLVFTAAFAFLLVRQRLTAYSTNAVVLLTLGAVVLGIHANGDRPPGETKREYFAGFFLTVLAAGLYGLILPLVELMYNKTKQPLSYALVMEIQFVLSFFSTAFSTVGMLVNNDFKAIEREARDFELGVKNYYMVLLWSAIIWQFFFMGAVGVIFCASSLFSAVLITVLLPVTEVLAVIFFHERFGSEKAISLVLSLWGFVSYFYGEIRHQLPTKSPIAETEITASSHSIP